MMKKSLSTFLGLILLVLAVYGFIIVSPFLKDPKFEVVNKSHYVVHVSAHWRDMSKELGPVQPSSTYVFSVSDEAAIKFIGHYPDGQNYHSEEIYFTGGTEIIATIRERSIEVKYNHGT